jgi:hypothetical protein
MLLKESDIATVKVGMKYTLSSDLGDLNRGDNVTITKITPLENDVEVFLVNEDGVSDVFYLDKEDNYEL